MNVARNRKTIGRGKTGLRGVRGKAATRLALSNMLGIAIQQNIGPVRREAEKEQKDT